MAILTCCLWNGDIVRLDTSDSTAATVVGSTGLTLGGISLVDGFFYGLVFEAGVVSLYKINSDFTSTYWLNVITDTGLSEGDVFLENATNGFAIIEKTSTAQSLLYSVNITTLTSTLLCTLDVLFDGIALHDGTLYLLEQYGNTLYSIDLDTSCDLITVGSTGINNPATDDFNLGGLYSDGDTLYAVNSGVDSLYSTLYSISEEDGEATLIGNIGELLAGAAGVAGDPHFVGFDGATFDYEGKENTPYCLYQDNRLLVNAVFTKNNIDNRTYIGEVFVSYDGKATHLNNNNFTANSSVNRMDCIPESLQFVAGDVVDTFVQTVRRGKVIVSRMLINGFTHLNVAFNMTPANATGIIGQTSKNKIMRIANESFELTSIESMLPLAKVA